MKNIIILTFIFILLTGCQSFNQIIKKDQTEEIVNNPNSFINKTVFIKGKLEPSANMRLYKLNIKHNIKNYDGFGLYLKPNVKNEIFNGLLYNVKGIIQSEYICICEYQSPISKNYISFLNGNFPTVTDCENINNTKQDEQRCRPGTKETIYYINANSMKRD